MKGNDVSCAPGSGDGEGEGLGGTGSLSTTHLKRECVRVRVCNCDYTDVSVYIYGDLVGVTPVLSGGRTIVQRKASDQEACSITRAASHCLRKHIDLNPKVPARS